MKPQHLVLLLWQKECFPTSLGILKSNSRQRCTWTTASWCFPWLKACPGERTGLDSGLCQQHHSASLFALTEVCTLILCSPFPPIPVHILVVSHFTLRVCQNGTSVAAKYHKNKHSHRRCWTSRVLNSSPTLPGRIEFAAVLSPRPP